MTAATDASDGVLSRLDYPMVIVTAAAGDRRAGCLVGFHTQCSIDPLRYLVCISEANRTKRVADDAPVLAVHFLSPADLELARLFGEETGDDVDKFALCEWRPGPQGVPVLEMQGGWLAGPVVDRRESGDHTAMIVEAAAAGVPTADGQLGFQRAKDLAPGHPA